jgi:hypothetical protein
LPEATGTAVFGPDLRAAVVTLTARNRIYRRDMGELVRELCGIKLSVGRWTRSASAPRMRSGFRTSS